MKRGNRGDNGKNTDNHGKGPADPDPDPDPNNGPNSNPEAYSIFSDRNRRKRRNENKDEGDGEQEYSRSTRVDQYLNNSKEILDNRELSTKKKVELRDKEIVKFYSESSSSTEKTYDLKKIQDQYDQKLTAISHSPKSKHEKHLEVAKANQDYKFKKDHIEHAYQEKILAVDNPRTRHGPSRSMDTTDPAKINKANKEADTLSPNKSNMPKSRTYGNLWELW